MRQVNGDTLRVTTGCMYQFHCLENSGWDMCPVTRPIEPRGVLLEICLRESCPYLTSRQGRPLCTCPTRCEIYERYGL